MSSSLRQALRARFRSPDKSKDATSTSGDDTSLGTTTHWKALEEEEEEEGGSSSQVPCVHQF